MAIDRKAWRKKLNRLTEASVNNESVYYISGKKEPVKAQILKVDSKNRVFTVLLRLGQHHLKWVSLDRVTIEVPAADEEIA